MSLWSWIMSWFSPAPLSPGSPSPGGAPLPAEVGPSGFPRKRRPRVRLTSNTHRHRPRRPRDKSVPAKPYEFARPSPDAKYFDFTTDGDAARLAAFGLPVFQTPQDLARWLNVPLGRLAWLVHRFSDHQRPETVGKSHYHYVWIRKKVRGERLIEAPKPSLKAVQNRILREILDKVPPHTAAHGFVKKKSIRSNAAPHVGQRVVLKIDLENFYPTVTFSRVVAIFRSLGYCREAALWLARLTTSDAPDEVRMQLYQRLPDAERWRPYARRHLPQGASTSPALANLSAFVLDLRLAGLARKFNARYTRYADDLTFSLPAAHAGPPRLGALIGCVKRVVEKEGFHIHPEKTRVARPGGRQTVTGLVVNGDAAPRAPRKLRRQLRAALHNRKAGKPRPDGETATQLHGLAAYVYMTDPALGRKLLAEIDG
jgi:RNA-directed DNA polymerase